MCLTNAKRILPEEDIICYKVVQVIRDQYFSPYFNKKKWKLGKLESLKNRTDAITSVVWSSYEKGVYGGAYHTYSSFTTAKQFVDFLCIGTLRSNLAVLECVIPKSSRYVYKGITENDGEEEFASQKLKPIRRVY